MRAVGNLMIGLVLMISVLPVLPGAVKGEPSSQIFINELMYDPITTELEGEWVELCNGGTQPVNMYNWTVSDQDGGVDFVFPYMEFPMGAFAVIHVGQGQNSTGFVDGVADFYMWKTSSIWSATGDDVLLANATGATMDFLSFGQWNGSSVDQAPADFPYEHGNWTVEEGFSLALFEGGFLESVPTPGESNGAGGCQPILITEVYYDTFGENEYIRITNPLDSVVDISHWYISDGSRVAAFPSATSISPGATITLAQNSSNFLAQFLEVPDFEYPGGNSTIPDMEPIGTLPWFVNDGGEVFIYNNFRSQIDAFVYGYSVYNGTGWCSGPAPDLKQGYIAKRNRNTSYIDTNTSADWLGPRPYFIGQSDLGVATFSTNGKITLFSSPDSSFQAITGALDTANQSIWLNIYEFTNTRLADRLLDAIARGVEVRMFLEGAPVGGINETELHIARQVVESGGQVRILTNDPDEGIYARYDYDHAKYAVIDGQSILIMSENWGWTGVPEPGLKGNRGWGAHIHDVDLAAYFSDVFLEDWNPSRMDSVAFGPDHDKWGSGVNWTSVASEAPARFRSATFESLAQITPVIAPDNALLQETVLGMLAGAQERVWVEEFYIYKHWGDKVTGSTDTTPNLYLEAVIEAARRGCEVRILMDASYYNQEDTDPLDNDDTVEYVTSIAAEEGLDLEAKLVNFNEHDFVKIHNKGLIADASVLISSINWNLNSVTENREAGVIIQCPEVAAYFGDIFQYDWMDDTTPPFAQFYCPAECQVNTTLDLNASATIDGSPIANYTWMVNGIVICWEVNFTHNFTICGNQTLNLTVRDSWGNVGYAEHSLLVSPEFVAPIIEPPPEDGNETADQGSDSVGTATMAVLLAAPLVIIAALAILYWKKK